MFTQAFQNLTLESGETYDFSDVWKEVPEPGTYEVKVTFKGRAENLKQVQAVQQFEVNKRLWRVAIAFFIAVCPADFEIDATVDVPHLSNWHTQKIQHFWLSESLAPDRLPQSRLSP